MHFPFLLLFISSALPLVQGIPSPGITPSPQESELVDAKAHPSPSSLTEGSKRVPYSLLHPNQLMNSSADCEAFTNGTSPSEFSSPKYPQHYPNNIDCIKIIQAPEGHVVLVQVTQITLLFASCFSIQHFLSLPVPRLFSHRSSDGSWSWWELSLRLLGNS